MQFLFTKEDFSKIGKDLAETIVEAGMSSSKTAARKEIKNGAVKLNDVKILDPFARLAMIDEEFIVIQKEEFMNVNN